MGIAAEKQINQANGQQAGRKGEFANRLGGQNKGISLSPYARDIASGSLSAKFAACRKLAANKCTDALVHVAENYPGKDEDASQVREHAVWHLQDDVEALKHVIKNSKHEDSKRFAFLRLLSNIDKVEDVEALKLIVLEFGRAFTISLVVKRLSAIVGKVDDLHALGWVGKLSEDEQSAETAVNKIFEKIGTDSDESYRLMAIIKERKRDGIAKFASEKLASIVEKVGDLRVLEFIALYSEDGVARGKACTKIAQKVYSIAESWKSLEDERRKAEKELSEDERRKAAEEFLKHLDALENIKEKSVGKDTQANAAEQLEKCMEDMRKFDVIDNPIRLVRNVIDRAKAIKKNAEEEAERERRDVEKRENYYLCWELRANNREKELRFLRGALGIYEDEATRRFFGLEEEKSVEKSDGQRVSEILKKTTRLGEIAEHLTYAHVGIEEKIEACEKMCMGMFEEICREIDEVYWKLDEQYHLPGKHKRNDWEQRKDAHTMVRGEYYKAKMLEIYEKLEEIGDTPGEEVIREKRSELKFAKYHAERLIEEGVKQDQEAAAHSQEADAQTREVNVEARGIAMQSLKEVKDEITQKLGNDAQMQKEAKAKLLKEFGHYFNEANSFIDTVRNVKALGEKVEVERFEEELRNILLAG